MKHLAPLTPIIPAVLFLASCKDDQQQILHLQQELAQAVQQTQEAQQAADGFQLLAMVVFVFAVVALIFGTILGSSAKKHASKKP